VQRLLVRVRASVHSWPAGRLVWCVGIAALGLAVVMVGAVMLALPGPGWAIIFLGLRIWSTEFPWARRLLHFVRRHVKGWMAWIGRRPHWLWAGIGAVCLVLLCAGAWLVLM
jgi:uncharacterized protein (TIGR02611 family)